MNFYRIAYELPKSHQRMRATFVSEPHEALPLAAEVFCKPLGAYLLSINEIRMAELNNTLELTP